MKYVLIVLSVFLCGCTGSSVLKAPRISLLDEHFIMGKKRYKIYVPVLARITSSKGRYTIAGDTIYLLGKKSGKVYPLTGYALPDTRKMELVYTRLDNNFSKNYTLLYYRPNR